MKDNLDPYSPKANWARPQFKRKQENMPKETLTKSGSVGHIEDCKEPMKNEAIKFVKWILKNSLDIYDDNGNVLHVYEGVSYTTENLYAEFKKLNL